MDIITNTRWTQKLNIDFNTSRKPDGFFTLGCKVVNIRSDLIKMESEIGKISLIPDRSYGSKFCQFCPDISPIQTARWQHRLLANDPKPIMLQLRLSYPFNLFEGRHMLQRI